MEEIVKNSNHKKLMKGGKVLAKKKSKKYNIDDEIIIGYNTSAKKDNPPKKKTKKNDKNHKEPLLGRVFIQFQGDFNNKKFKVKEIHPKIYKDKTIEGIEVPSTYLFDESKLEERYIDGKIDKERADKLEHKVFESLNSFKKKITEANDNITELREQLNNTRPNIFTLRDKILYVIDSIYVKRISRFVCEIKVINKWTGEQRTYEYDTRKLQVMHFEVVTRPALHLK